MDAREWRIMQMDTTAEEFWTCRLNCPGKDQGIKLPVKYLSTTYTYRKNIVPAQVAILPVSQG